MNWLTETLKSSLGKKLLMALTGLFLILFLVGHALGNTLLFSSDGGQAFNEYAKFMTTTPAIMALSYVTYISILGHVIYAIVLTRKNTASRPVKYAVNSRSENSGWASRNMGILGTIALVFIVIHLKSFWYEYKFGELPMVEYNGVTMKNLYAIVVAAFEQWWYSAFYVVAMIAIGFHLSHGFSSAFQTLGLTHKKYTPFIKRVGLLYTVAITLLFASMPIYIYLKSVL